MKIKGIIILFLVLSAGLQAQENIAAARAMGEGERVSISGVVTNGSELGIIRYIQDESAGLAIYSTRLADVKRGDSLTLTGVLKDYNTLLEMDPVKSFTNHGPATLPEALELTPDELSENHEGMLVRVLNASINGEGFFRKLDYSFTASGQTGLLYISSDVSPLIDKPIPQEAVSITGPLGSYRRKYQIPPRDEEDLISTSTIQISKEPRLSALSTTGLTMLWESDVEGSTEAFWGSDPSMNSSPLKIEGNATSHSLSIVGLQASEFVYVQPFSVTQGDTARAAMQIYITASNSEGSMRALFNCEPDQSVSLGLTEAEYFPEGLDEELIVYIDAATESIDLAIYNLDNKNISDISAALNRAHNRGVRVRVVYDGERKAYGINDLLPAIGRHASPRTNYPYYGIMHHKFLIIDAYAENPDLPVVWTGSTNLSDLQINNDPNDVIVIQDRSLALVYELEFNEMYGSEGAQPDPGKALFGPYKKDNTPHILNIGGSWVECYFSPSDPTQKAILEGIKSGDESIHVATMLMTQDILAFALAEKAEEGLRVEVLMHDYDQYGSSALNTLKKSLVDDVRLNGEFNLMHHKYMIVDQGAANSDPLVLTGSHNWSASASLRNDENTLVIHDQGMANAYYQEFVSRFANGKILTSMGQLSIDPNGSLGIYPNPALSWFSLQNHGTLELESLLIYDISGRIVRRYRENIPGQISVANMAEGIYLLQASFSNGSSQQLKLVIGH